MLKFVFVKCNNDTIVDGVCKSDIEIQNFLKRKFITTIHNEVRFDTSVYDDRKLVKEAVLTWYPIHS